MNTLDSALARQPALPRFLCHIYQRLKQGHLNIVTGAGISIDAGVPSWVELLERLAEESLQLKQDLGVHKKSGLTPEYLGQIIYHRHAEFDRTQTVAIDKEVSINHGWAEAIHQALYKNVGSEIEETIKKHPYLEELQRLVRKVPFVINFNFDDILAQTVGYCKKRDKDHVSYSVEWRPPLADRKKHTTIYHVNGLLPQVALKKRSPNLIFTEDSFADAIARAPGVSAEYLFMRFVQNTMLILGHSLSDSSLKNYLRQNRDKYPSNHHYMIYWLKDEVTLSDGQRKDIFDANLELYNVITIFMTSDEIRLFLKLINSEERDFRDSLDDMGEDVRSSYHYYIVGPVASGKSSLLENLRCFGTFEEWTQLPPPELYMSFDKLTDEQKITVDDFIYKELKEKNSRFSKCDIGFHFMDRAPLDLYAFSLSDEENKKKTSALRRNVTKGKVLQVGEIIFLTANGKELVKRNYCRGRAPGEAGEASYLEKQSNDLREIYNPTVIFETDTESAQLIAKKVVRHVLFDAYDPVNLETIMKRYE